MERRRGPRHGRHSLSLMDALPVPGSRSNSSISSSSSRSNRRHSTSSSSSSRHGNSRNVDAPSSPYALPSFLHEKKRRRSTPHKKRDKHRSHRYGGRCESGDDKDDAAEEKEWDAIRRLSPQRQAQRYMEVLYGKQKDTAVSENDSAERPLSFSAQRPKPSKGCLSATTRFSPQNVDTTPEDITHQNTTAQQPQALVYATPEQEPRKNRIASHNRNVRFGTARTLRYEKGGIVERKDCADAESPLQDENNENDIIMNDVVDDEEEDIEETLQLQRTKDNAAVLKQWDHHQQHQYQHHQQPRQRRSANHNHRTPPHTSASNNHRHAHIFHDDDDDDDDDSSENELSLEQRQALRKSIRRQSHLFSPGRRSLLEDAEPLRVDHDKKNDAEIDNTDPNPENRNPNAPTITTESNSSTQEPSKTRKSLPKKKSNDVWNRLWWPAEMKNNEDDGNLDEYFNVDRLDERRPTRAVLKGLAKLQALQTYLQDDDLDDNSSAVDTPIRNDRWLHGFDQHKVLQNTLGSSLRLLKVRTSLLQMATTAEDEATARSTLQNAPAVLQDRVQRWARLDLLNVETTVMQALLAKCLALASDPTLAMPNNNNKNALHLKPANLGMARKLAQIEQTRVADMEAKLRQLQQERRHLRQIQAAQDWQWAAIPPMVTHVYELLLAVQFVWAPDIPLAPGPCRYVLPSAVADFQVVVFGDTDGTCGGIAVEAVSEPADAGRVVPPGSVAASVYFAALDQLQQQQQQQQNHTTNAAAEPVTEAIARTSRWMQFWNRRALDLHRVSQQYPVQLTAISPLQQQDETNAVRIDLYLDTNVPLVLEYCLDGPPRSVGPDRVLENERLVEHGKTTMTSLQTMIEGIRTSTTQQQA